MNNLSYPYPHCRRTLWSTYRRSRLVRTLQVRLNSIHSIPMRAKRINLPQIMEGDKIKVVQDYSSYGANEQEIVFFIVAKKTEKGKIGLFKENGERFYQGINSHYHYFLIEN